jgi:hypothetical protein
MVRLDTQRTRLISGRRPDFGEIRSQQGFDLLGGDADNPAFRILSMISLTPFFRSSMVRSTSFRTSSYLSLPSSLNFDNSEPIRSLAS